MASPSGQSRRSRRRHHFLTFGSEQSSAQWWAQCRHFLFLEPHFLLFAVWSSCRMLFRKWMVVSDKRRELLLYRLQFHTHSQSAGSTDCSCLTPQQTDRPVEIAGQLKWAFIGHQVPQRPLPDLLSCGFCLLTETSGSQYQSKMGVVSPVVL